MKYHKSNFIFALLGIAIIYSACSNENTPALMVAGLKAPVDVVRDSFGINHIYAQDQRDLFFSQGYLAARDRLFQFEIWRRQATGTVAEILGKRELRRDIGTRLFRFRGDMEVELNHYHQEGKEIINAYVDGVNAYIDEIMKTPEKLPVEFSLLGIVPEKWTPEVVISRHQGLLGNIGEELSIGRAVAKVGVEKVKQLEWFHPKDPDIKLDPAINKESLSNDILGLYNAYRRGITFLPSDLKMGVPENASTTAMIQWLNNEVIQNDLTLDHSSIGSNNWVLTGEHMESGKALMANDPHRRIAVPSLRYMVHLVAPGWNVIGGGEPEIPGVSIGHNEYGAWGLTVFETDGEDLYVYDLNPDNLNQYKYKDQWEDMSVIKESIKVKDEENVDVELKYTRHGPVTYIDSVNLKAYAVRCAWMEPGGSPYLASLRMDQARNWDEFREACNFSNIPGENMVWADIDNNIGWQSVGIAPIRKNFSGLVPVPGDGRFEWDGYLEIKEKPHVFNPPGGIFVTANQDVIPKDYNHWDAVGYTWADDFRGDRLREVLSSGDKFTIQEMQSLQTDYFSIPASNLVNLLKPVQFEDSLLNNFKSRLIQWNFVLDKNSIEAGIFVAWQDKLTYDANNLIVPESIRGDIRMQMSRILEFLNNENDHFGLDFTKGRDEFLRSTFSEAIDYLKAKLGDNPDDWKYGQEEFKHILIEHPLGEAVNEEYKNKLNVGPAPRGGNSYTVGSTGGSLNQNSGASFRVIIPAGDWDNAVGINTPGQSGDPESPFYKNLFNTWANDRYFPLYFSKEKINTIRYSEIKLQPGGKAN